MTPDEFAAILAARTPGEVYIGGPAHVRAAVNLAPLLLDLWRAAQPVRINHKEHEHPQWPSVECDECHLIRAEHHRFLADALAALEAAEPTSKSLAQAR